MGQAQSAESYDDEEYFGEQPKWFTYDKVTLSIDEATIENKDEMTLVSILRESKNVKAGEIIELVTTFLPAPGIDTLRSKGYSAWVKKEDRGKIKSYFLKPDD